MRHVSLCQKYLDVSYDRFLIEMSNLLLFGTFESDYSMQKKNNNFDTNLMFSYFEGD
jgi:hypothetical protein